MVFLEVLAALIVFALLKAAWSVRRKLVPIAKIMLDVIILGVLLGIAIAVLVKYTEYGWLFFLIVAAWIIAHSMKMISDWQHR